MANCKELHIIGSQAYKDCLEKNKEKDEDVVEVIEEDVVEVVDEPKSSNALGYSNYDENTDSFILQENLSPVEVSAIDSNANIFGTDVFTYDLSLMNTKNLFDKIDTQDFKPEVNLFGLFPKDIENTSYKDNLQKLQEDLDMGFSPISLSMTSRQESFVNRVASEDVQNIVLRKLANKKVTKSLDNCKDGYLKCFDTLQDNVDNQGLRYLDGDQKRIAELNLELQKAVKTGDQDLIKDINSDLKKVRGNQYNSKSKLYDPATGKFVSVKYVDGELNSGDLSEEGLGIEQDALTLVSQNLVNNNGDVGVLQSKQNQLYYEILALSDIVIANYDKVSKGKDKGITQETVENVSNLFNGNKSLKAIRKMSETGILPKDLRLDYFTEGKGTILGTAFNKKINEFLVTSRAVLLNENPIEEEDNVFLEGLNRKVKDFTGTNLLNENDVKNSFIIFDNVLGESGLDFMDQAKKNENLYTSIAELSYNTTLDLVPLMAAMYGQNKIKGFRNLIKGVGRVGNYINKSFNPNNSKIIRNVINTVVGLNSKGSSGVKELIKLGTADEILKIGFGQEPMPAEFGIILGSTNSIMEQKFVAASLVNLSRKIPGVKYIYGSKSGKKIINTLVGAGIGTGAMTFTEAAQYALGKSEYEKFSEVFMSSDPNQPKIGKLASLYVSFAAIGLGNSSTAKAIYKDLKQQATGINTKVRSSVDLLNKESGGLMINIDGKKDYSNLSYKDLSSDAVKNIQNAKSKAIGRIKKDTKLTQEQKDAKIKEIKEASEFLTDAREYSSVMDSFSKSETYGKQIEKESNNVIQKLSTAGDVGLNSLKPSEVDFITSTDPIVLARSISQQQGVSMKQAKIIANKLKKQTGFLSDTASEIVGNNRAGESGKLRNEVIDVLREAGTIQNSIENLSKPDSKREYGITAELQVEKLKQRLVELKDKLGEQQNQATALTEAKAIKDAALFGDANVKVSMLSGKEYEAMGFEKSEAVFEQKGGEIFLNMDILRNTKSQNVVVHEVGHKIVLNQLKNLDGNLTSSGKRMLEGFRDLVPKEQRKLIEKALSKNYKDKSKDKQLEEFFTIFSEKMADGEIVLPGEMRKVEGLKNPADLFNLVRRLQDNLRRVAEGTTDKLDANLIEAIELGTKNAKVEGEQYSKPIKFKKNEAQIEALMNSEGLTRKEAEAKNLANQINSLVTTESKIDFQKKDRNNIVEGIMNGDFDSLFARGLTPEKIQMVRDETAIRVVGRTSKGGFDPAQGKFSTWLYNSFDKAKLDVIKELAIEANRPEYSLENNYKEAASVLDSQSGFEITGEAPSLQRSTIKKILNLQPNEIDNVKRSIAKIVFGKESVQGLENLTRKDIQSIRQEFLKSETGDGTKIRKIVLNKINELGKNGLSTTSGVELVHSGISLSRMSNSLKGGGKGYDIFLEPVLKDNGEQARYSVEEANKLGIALDKSGSGPLKYKKRPLSDFTKDGVPTQEYLDWIQGKDIASGARGRKDSIVNEITGELGMEAMLSTMVDQKIVIPPVLDANGKVIEPARTEDLFPNATPEQKTKMATDAIINFVGDKVSRVYKNTKNLLYSKKDLAKFNEEIQGTKGENDVFNIGEFTEIFNKQGKDFKKLFNQSVPGGDFVAYINNLSVKQIEEISPLWETELKKGSPEYYKEYANYRQDLKNYKRYLKEIGVEYTPEKKLVQPEFNADGTKNSQNIVRTKGWMKTFIRQFGPWEKLSKDKQKFILGTVGFGKNLRKELGLTKQGRTTEQMLIDAFGKDVLTGEKTVELPDLYQIPFNQATKSKFEVLIKDKDKYTTKQLRDEMVKLLIPKGKGVEYFEIMVANNTKALDATLNGFLNQYENSSNKTRTFEDITNMLKYQTNNNMGIKSAPPITSVHLEAKSSINKKGELTNKKMHFEHNKELFNMSKEFLEVLRSDKPLEVKKELIAEIAKNSTQSIISEQLRFEKDAAGRTVSGSLDPDMATYGYREGAAANAIDLLNPYGGTVAQKIQNKLKNKIVNNLIKLDTKGNKNIIMPKPENGLIFEKNSKGEIIGSYSKKQHNARLSKSLNEILFRTKDINPNLKVSRIQGKKEGASKGGFMNMFYGAEDFGGLTYSILAGKGKAGEADQAFF